MILFISVMVRKPIIHYFSVNVFNHNLLFRVQLLIERLIFINIKLLLKNNNKLFI